MFVAKHVDPLDLVESLSSLEHMVALAKVNGVKDLLVTKEVLSQVLKTQYPAKSGYMVYKNVRLIEQDRRDEVLAKEGLTVEDLLFKGSKAPIGAGATTAQVVD